MGLDNSALNLLACAKSSGCDFSKSLMVGRQTVYASEIAFDRVFKALNIAVDASALARAPYAEQVFTHLGATEVASLDGSNYENATLVHDLNQPIPDHMRQQYTLVHDGGTLEHVFNYPQALKSCMEMVAPGGTFTQVIGANNMMGHGFWQISPELIYRAFSKENGFEVVALLLNEVVPGGRWFKVSDPAVVRRRVELCNSVPVFMLLIARRIAVVPIFAHTPQQSDYSTMWRAHDGGSGQPSVQRADRQPAVVRLLGTKTTNRLRDMSRPLARLRSAVTRRGAFVETYYQQVAEAAVVQANFNK
jgi:hypothetical protein